MEKTVIIINGIGGAGKDTLCDFASEYFRTKNISAITPIKDIARQHGWQGEKDNKSRKFLADLKSAFTAYNDLPCQYLMKEYLDFLKSDAQLLFVHIREGEEIKKFKQQVTIPCRTLLIRRKALPQTLGNASDDNVELYHYDHCYHNDLPLLEAKTDFIHFLQTILS